MSITDTAFELIISESYAGEIECESKHKYSTHTGEVTHILSYCKATKRICQGACAGVIRILRSKEIERRCADCKRPARDCWSIRPI